MLGLFMILALVNGNFSDGLNHWQADAGWSAQRGAAVLHLDNRAGVGTLGANLCSESVDVRNTDRVQGSAVIRQSAGGYLFVGLRWYDKHGTSMSTEMIASGEGNEGKRLRLNFATRKPTKAASASFCFFGGAYAGSEFIARADNAELK